MRELSEYELDANIRELLWKFRSIQSLEEAENQVYEIQNAIADLYSWFYDK